MKQSKEFQAALQDLVRTGMAEVVGYRDGRPCYRLTEKARAMSEAQAAAHLMLCPNGDKEKLSWDDLEKAAIDAFDELGQAVEISHNNDGAGRGTRHQSRSASQPDARPRARLCVRRQPGRTSMNQDHALQMDPFGDLRSAIFRLYADFRKREAAGFDRQRKRDGLPQGRARIDRGNP